MRTPTLTRHASLALAAVAAVAGLAACSPDPQGGAGDAPIGAVEQEPWTVINNIDGFPNIATRCREGDGLYVTRSSGDATDTLVVIPNDPACAAGGAGGPSPSGTAVPR